MSTEPVSDERLRQAVRDVLAEELDQNGDQPSTTRRQVLGSIAAGGVLGGLAGAGSAAGATGGEDTSALVGSLAGPPYKTADPGLYTGPDSSKSSVSRSVGQYFRASDTRQTYYDTGSAWDNLSPREVALNAGYIVAVGQSYHEIYDPTDYATADVAIQAAHDELANNFGPSDVGEVWIPATDPDGNELEIASTVTFDGNDSSRFTGIVPQGWGHSIAGASLQITIDDGSPAFEVRDYIGPAEWGGLVGVGAVANNDASGTEEAADASLLKLENVQGHTVRGCAGRNLGKTAAPAVFLVGSSVFNSRLVEFQTNVKTGASLPNSVAWEFSDTAATESPGEVFVSGFTQYAPQGAPTDQSLRVVDSSDTIHFDNSRFEGAGSSGNPVIEIAGGCELIFGANMQFDRVEGTNVHHIETTGNNARLHLPDAVTFGPNDTGGNHLTLIAGTKGYIGAFQGNGSVGSNGGVDISIDGTSPNRLVIPHAEVMENGVSYPSGPWNGKRYHDGTQRYRENTGETVSAGGTTKLNTFMDGRIRLRYLGITNNNGGEPRLDAQWSWDTTDGNQTIVIEEVGGAVGATFDWEVVKVV